jgi:F-type H+-transporting ATPase subunit epsilon
MAATFNLQITTPEREFFNDAVEMVIVQTPLGEMGILPNHEQMVVVVEIGHIQIKKEGKWLDAVLSSGFMEITDESTVILCDTAEWPHEIDETRANLAKQRAEERLNQQLSKLYSHGAGFTQTDPRAEERLQHQISQHEYVRSQAALARAMSRLKVKKRNS